MSGKTVEVKIVRQVYFGAVLNGVLRRGLTRIMLAGHKAAVANAPVDKGILRGGLAPGAGVTQVDTANPPKWAMVGTNVKTYPGVLNESDKTHYRSGPNAGRGTKGWLDSIEQAVAPEMNDLVKRMAGEFVEGWKRG